MSCFFKSDIFRIIGDSWSKVSGSGTVTFGEASAVDTTASFDATGGYVLRLIADDGEQITYDEVTITVNVPDSEKLYFYLPLVIEAFAKPVENNSQGF